MANDSITYKINDFTCQDIILQSSLSLLLTFGSLSGPGSVVYQFQTDRRPKTQHKTTKICLKYYQKNSIMEPDQTARKCILDFN